MLPRIPRKFWFGTLFLLFMYWLYVMCKTTLLSSFIVTLVTIILHSFMYRLNVSCEITLPWSSMVTLITFILHFFMYWLYMGSKTILLSSYIVTLTTNILYSFMCYLYMSSKIILSSSYIITLVTVIQSNALFEQSIILWALICLSSAVARVTSEQYWSFHSSWNLLVVMVWNC